MSDDGPEYDVDFRENPEEYEIGRGEEGVFKIQPYKDELLPLWTFRTPEEAKESAAAIHERYEEYREADDFRGMDMARKYLQMGYTRAGWLPPPAQKRASRHAGDAQREVSRRAEVRGRRGATGLGCER